MGNTESIWNSLSLDMGTLITCVHVQHVGLKMNMLAKVKSLRHLVWGCGMFLILSYDGALLANHTPRFQWNVTPYAHSNLQISRWHQHSTVMYYGQGI